MALKTFPAILARENSILWELTGTTISGGQTASGIVPIVRMDGGGLWKATLADVPLVTREQVLAWRATTAYCDGGAQPIILPMCDLRHAPIIGVPSADVPHSDNSPFNDDTPYQSGTNIIAIVDGPHELRATLVSINITQGGKLEAGQYFSIDDATIGPRLYRVMEVFPDGFICRIRPPLRAPLTAFSTPVDFNRPSCVMRLASSDAMDLTLQMRKFGNPTVNFIEAFPPFPPEA